MTTKERPVIVYFSGTGQTDKLVSKINKNKEFDTLRVRTGKETINRDYILITPTYMKGEIPKQIQRLIQNNRAPKEVIGTGNRQWGEFFCGARKQIASMFNIPLIAKVEQSGHFNEVEKILNYFRKEYKVIGA